METCSRCAKSFDRETAEDTFMLENGLLNYDNFQITVCGDCANEIIDNCEDGYYFEICDRCGKRFDLFVDESDFMTRNDSYFGGLRDAWDEFGYLLCADCASDDVADAYGDNSNWR